MKRKLIMMIDESGKSPPGLLILRKPDQLRQSKKMRVVHLGRSTCLAIIGRVKVPNHLPWSRRGHLLSSQKPLGTWVLVAALFARALPLPREKGTT